ncbi:excinuclease ABC subunit A [Bordetella pertussis]|nr:excinuclease ABC subunit A [Bordetella pertussis]CFV95992.1 excinuclease ABC subunit A [Bordetella pertussis]CFW33090.1 excinuclease ABC subunit A [Bordetella pertussis]
MMNSTRPATTTGRRPQRSEARPKGICMKAWVRPYMPSARPTRAGSLPPGRSRAATAKTGSSRNRPSIRHANRPAKATLARRSERVSCSFWSAGMQA